MGALLLFGDLVHAERDGAGALTRCGLSWQDGALQAGTTHPVGIAPAGTETGQPQRMEAGRSIPPFPGSLHSRPTPVWVNHPREH